MLEYFKVLKKMRPTKLRKIKSNRNIELYVKWNFSLKMKKFLDLMKRQIIFSY